MRDLLMESKARIASIGASFVAAGIGGVHLLAGLSGFMTSVIDVPKKPFLRVFLSSD